MWECKGTSSSEEENKIAKIVTQRRQTTEELEAEDLNEKNEDTNIEQLPPAVSIHGGIKFKWKVWLCQLNHRTKYHRSYKKKLIITKADKSNCKVIVKKEVYNQKILEKLLKEVEFVFEKQLIKKLSSENTNFLVLYGLMKIHKSDRIKEIPVRPAVVHCNSPSYKIAK
ncbi:hypothetical protein HHI36_020093 [Cryptolaemus montrouzieri]|uniref:Uncharacterized protein n=1 Tax=Cryptolaemus montrouzieri TaxID=559131 RepID=A0ABD2N9G0_9CUCU